MVLIKQKSLLKPLIELFFASALWGFGFIGTIWALQFIGFPAVIFYRFFIAFIVGLAILFLQKVSTKIMIAEFRNAVWPGLFLSTCLILQTWGLKTVSASKSSFITVMYVIIVPILAYFYSKERLNPWHWASVALALLGTALIVDLQWSSWTIGDTVTVGNAFMAAVHIIAIDQLTKKSKNLFAFNVFQSFWTALFALSFAPLDNRWDLMTMNLNGWIGIISLSFGSSLIAFFLQVRSQQVLSPSIASVVFLMESPFTLLFAYFLLGDRLSSSQFVGAGLIIIACLTAVFLQSRQKSTH